MLRLVSVDPELNDVKSHLNTCGYEVVNMNECIRSVEAVIYHGQPLLNNAAANNMTAENTVLINAAGLTPEEVVAQLENRLS